MDLQAFRNHLEWAEGREKRLYTDSVGKLSIGVGRNLEDVGLSDDEIDYLLENDMRRAVRDASSLSYWDSLSDVRKLVVADLCFNLGMSRFKGFVKANAALARGDWEAAADEMVDSKWYTQVGRRAKKLIFAMRHDRLPKEDEQWMLSGQS